MGKAVLTGTVVGLLLAVHLMFWAWLAGQISVGLAIAAGLFLGCGFSLVGANIGHAVGRWWIWWNQEAVPCPKGFDSGTVVNPNAPQQPVISREQRREDARVARHVAIGGITGLLLAIVLIGWFFLISLDATVLVHILWVVPIFFLSGCHLGEAIGWWRTRALWQRRIILRQFVIGLLRGLSVGLVLWGVIVLILLMSSYNTNPHLLIYILAWGLLLLPCSLMGGWYGFRKGAAIAMFCREGPPGTVRFPTWGSRL